jgi:hypothetical protein
LEEEAEVGDEAAVLICLEAPAKARSSWLMGTTAFFATRKMVGIYEIVLAGLKDLCSY